MMRWLSVLLLLLPGLATGQDRLPLRGDSIGVVTGLQAAPFGSSYAFADCLKAATDWSARYYDGKQTVVIPCTYTARGGMLIPATPDGVPNQATTWMFTGRTDYPTGVYVFTWEGDADFARESSPGQVAQRWGGVDGRAEVLIDATDPNGLGIVLNCTRSNPANPAKNMRFWAPGCEGSKSAFTPQYVRSLRGFGIIRTVKETGTENSEAWSWKARPQLSDPRWTTPDQVPIEALCELANTSGCDLWICIPHLADDDYFQKSARLVKRELSKGRKVYLELSNEVWNWMYTEAQYQVGREIPKGDPTAILGNWTNWYPYRSRQLFDAWEAEFTGSDRARLITVISGQHVLPDVGRFWLKHAAKFARDGKPCDAFATGAYFNTDLTDASGKLDPTEDLAAIFADLAKQIDGPYRKQCRDNRQLADDFGVRLIAYESGQHLTSNDADTQAVFIAANRDARMEGIYRQFLQVIFDSGYERVVLMQDLGLSGFWGSFGLRESGTKTLEESPKLRGVLDYLRDANDPITPDVMRLPAPAGPPKVPDTVPILIPVKPAA